MITKTTVIARPSTEVDFPLAANPGLQAHINQVYASSTPLKLLSRSQSISKDLLTLMITQVFADEAALNEFDNDPQWLAFVAERDAYAAANGIIVSSSSN